MGRVMFWSRANNIEPKFKDNYDLLTLNIICGKIVEGIISLTRFPLNFKQNVFLLTDEKWCQCQKGRKFSSHVFSFVSIFGFM